MRKHKNLNKQELMIRQDIPCVHLGGKFVPLKSRVKSLLGEKRKKRAEKVLATVVMGHEPCQCHSSGGSTGRGWENGACPSPAPA